VEAEQALNEALDRLTGLREKTNLVYENRRQRLTNDLRDSGELADNERELSDLDIRLAALNDAIEVVSELRWTLLQR
jgi:hypothetical protein